MHPVTPIAIGAAGTAGGLAIMRLVLLLGVIIFWGSIKAIYFITKKTPIVSALILPCVILYTSFHDAYYLHSIFNWAFFRFGDILYATFVAAMAMTVVFAIWKKSYRDASPEREDAAPSSSSKEKAERHTAFLLGSVAWAASLGMGYLLIEWLPWETFVGVLNLAKETVVEAFSQPRECEPFCLR